MAHPSGRSGGAGAESALVTVPAQPRVRARRAAASSLSLGALLDHAPFGVLVGDLAGALVSWNIPAATLLGLAKETLGLPVSSFFADPAPVEAAFSQARAGLLDGRSPTHVVHTTDGRAHEVTSVPTRLEDGQAAVLVVLHDVTERDRAQASRDRLRDLVALLGVVSETLVDAGDAGEAMDRLSRLVVPQMADWVTMYTYDERGRTVRIGIHHSDPGFEALAALAGRDLPVAVPEESPSRRLARGEPAILIEQVTEEHLTAFVPDEGVRAMLRGLGVHSAMAVPIPGAERVMGAMVLMNRGGSPAFTHEDLAVAQEVARRGGVALAWVSYTAEQRELATALQASMLSEPPDLEDVEVEVRYAAAAHAAQVGGDWYDAFVQPCGSIVFSIGDVSGHDPQAAATMGQLRALLRGIAFGADAGPADLLAHLDATLDGLSVRATATAVVARMAPVVGAAGARVVEWTNAGHPPPVLVPAARDGVRGPARALEETPNVLIGLRPDPERDQHQFELEPGAVLLFYTDGLVERRREILDAGLERLLTAVDELAVGDDFDLAEMCDTLLEKLLPGQGEDDVALLAVRLRPGGGVAGAGQSVASAVPLGATE